MGSGTDEYWKMRKREREFEQACIENAKNFGEAQDIYHPDYGWILKDGKPTEAGAQFYLDNKEKLKNCQSQ